jgi:hypothetical protein
MVPIYDEYESDPGESQEEEEKEPVEQVISCPEPVNKQSSSKDSQPVSTSHPPMPTNEVQPCMSSCGAEQAFCYPFHKIFHSFYEPVNEYMEWHFLYALEPPIFISTTTLGDELKDVTILMLWLHRLLSITDKLKELPFRKLIGLAMVEVFFHLAPCKINQFRVVHK